MQRNQRISKLVRQRDKNACQCCYVSGDAVKIEVHHIQPLSLGGSDSEDNLICLCARCHKGAPDDPAEFLFYQKRRGSGGAERLSKVLAMPPQKFGCKDTAEVMCMYERMLRVMIDSAWAD
jgi:hypothetical protein